jgi:flagellar basal body-associated protein FliL
MAYRERKKSRWRIVVAVAVVTLALVSCGVLIFLAVQKVSAEKQVERKFAPSKTLAKPAQTLPPLPQSDE